MPILVPTVVRGALWTRLLSFVLSLSVLLLAVAPALATSIQTDLWVYAFGDTVNVSGDGFGAFETVEIVTTDPFGVEVDRGAVPSDDVGYINYSFVLNSDVPGIYDVVAVGLSSGLSAATQFDPNCMTMDSAGFVWRKGNFAFTATGTWKTNSGCVTPSTITVTANDSDGTSNQATGTPRQTVLASLNTATLTWSAAFSFTAGNPPDGTYDVKAVGSGSPVADYSAVRDDYFGVDNTAPLSTVDPIANQSPSTNFNVTGTASDASSGLVAGKVHVSLRRTSAPAGEVASADRSTSGGTWSWSPGGQVAGTYCVDSLATDSAGNVQSPAASACFTIGAVNGAPTANDDSPTVVEDSGGNTIAVLANDTDPDTGDALSVTAVGAASHGTASFTAAAVSYAPAANYCGPDTFSYTIGDGHGGSDTASVNVSVTCINDAPSFTKGADQAVLEDAGAQSVSAWALAISAGPANESGQAVNFIVSNNNNSLFSLQPAIAANGTLSYTPAANATGSAILTVQIHDDGGTANGGSDTSASQTFSISVGAINDAPSFIKGADETVLEDAGAMSVPAWATGLSAGPANESGQTLNFIVSNDNNGLFTVQPAVAANGTLSYTPTANANGIATVTVQIHDDGGTANGGSDTSASQTFTISVTAVNDGPSFTKGADETVLEDAGLQTVNGWATSISAGPADESGQAVDFIVSNNNNALFSAQPAIAADGTLTYTPAADANGSATVTVRIHDDGGLANGGVNTSASQTFTISVTAVNDAPVVIISGDFSDVDEGVTRTYTYTVTDIDSASPAVLEICSGVASPVADALPNSFKCKFLDGPGSGTVNVTADDGEFVGSDPHAVQVNNVAPTIAISGAANVNEGSSYSLTLGAVTDPGVDTVTSYIVHWGDGSSTTYGTNGVKSHTYADGPNDWDITVDLIDGDGTFNDAANDLSVHVNNVAPTVSGLSGDASVFENGVTTHTYSFTISDPGADTVDHVTVSCGTGGTFDSQTNNNTSGSFVCKFLDGPASPTVTAQATDSDLEDGNTDTFAVQVNNVAPTIAISGAANVNEGSSYSLTLGAVTDPGVDTVTSYIVHWGDGSSTTYGTNGVKSHTYADGPNDWDITVDLIDGDGNFNDAANDLSVHVNNVKPTPVIDSLTGTGGFACIGGNTVTLGFSWTDPAGFNDTYTYDVDWGDGSAHATPLGTVSSPISGLTHNYAPGSFTVTVTVNDEDEAGNSVSTGASFFYNTSGILQPINLTGPRSAFKIGSTIPVKLRVTDCNGASVGSLVLTVHLQKVDSTPEEVNEVVVVSNADTGVYMRYDGSGTQYIYNLSTKKTQFTGGQDLTNGTYHIWITGAGISQVNAYFDAKK